MTALDEIRANPINRALYGIAPIDDELVAKALINDDLFSVVYKSAPESMYDYIVREYGLPLHIVRMLAEQDEIAWCNAVINGKAARFEPLRVKFTSRLNVYVKNRAILQSLETLVPIGRAGYLDVGCGHGFTMLAARSMGFKKAHGIEVDPVFIRLGKKFFPDEQEAEIGYLDDDFLTVDFQSKYSLITFFDVMEHVADYDYAMQKAIDLLAPGGIIYFYQGNPNGVQMVRHEPHYRVPMLTQLPKDLAINILIRMGKITKPESYVVAKWPSFNLFNDRNASIINGPVNYRNGQTYLSQKQGDGVVKSIEKEYKEALAPLLSADEMAIVDASYADYLSRYEAVKSDPHLHERLFLMNSWNILVSRSDQKLPDNESLERI